MNKTSRIKIIAGKLRGRWIEFPNMPSIRPTPQRVRETLFNWLMYAVPNAVCLDAFAGSGALSFEALSRGASQVYVVDKNPALLAAFAENAQRFQLNGWQCLYADFLQQSFTTAQINLKFPRGVAPAASREKCRFNIVFLDPPFEQNLLLPALQHVIRENILAVEHFVYFEVEKSFDVAQLLPYCEILKNQVAGRVRYGLLQVK